MPPSIVINDIIIKYDNIIPSMNKAFLVLAIIKLLLVPSIVNAKNNVIFAGFSFGSILPENTISNGIFKENGGLLYINKLLVNKTKKLTNESFSINF